MDDNAARTLMLAIAGQEPLAEDGGRIAFFNAMPLPGAEPPLMAALSCEQGFKPLHLALARAGYDSVPQLREDAHEAALILATRSRKMNEMLLHRAWDSVKEGGAILVSGSKTDGIQALRKHAGECVSIDESISKHHAIAFVLTKAGGNPFPAADAATNGGTVARPGMFSADGPDSGSRLLAGAFGKWIRGKVGDFGAGWGYLGMELLKSEADPQLLICHEADYASLQAARANLHALAPGVAKEFHWSDLTSENPGTGYDWIIMNPPFHAGRAQEPSIGIAFIATAAKALKPGGRLLMVANRKLPYEKPLAHHFRRVQTLTEADGFKVIEAMR
ncbi:MAG: class I SAM-dependent methyltransferase [Nitratireductor sp.]|nr:class I SAM-dependent methyltransferase [Nitratireductor sp.]